MPPTAVCSSKMLPQSQCGNSSPYRGKLWERELGWKGGWMGTGVEHTHREWRRLCEISVP